MKIFIRYEQLSDMAAANDPAITLDQISIRFVRKKCLCHAGYRQRISDAGDGSVIRDRQSQRCADHAHDYLSGQSQGDDKHVDSLNAHKRNNHAAHAIYEKIPGQQTKCPFGAVFHAAKRQRY